MSTDAPANIALVHDWLIHMRGGEKVLEALCEVFPRADIFTLFSRRSRLSPVFKDRVIRNSFLAFLPGIRFYYRWLLPLFPLAVRTLDLTGYHLVISSSHCVAKGVKIPAGALHVCYCHTPVRYAWGFRDEYFGSFPGLLRMAVNGILNAFKKWDLRSNASVHFFIANSENTRRRIREFYGRDSEVIYPPADTRLFSVLKSADAGDYYLAVSALVPYKRVDLAVEAFNRLGKRLVVVGEGPEFGKLRRLADWHIDFMHNLSQKQLVEIYAGARALVFPGDEDFGIVPVEAQACGCPVIAYAKGGALESVTERTGVFFKEQTIESLVDAIRRFEKMSFDPTLIQTNARRFDREIFKEKIGTFVSHRWEERRAQRD